MMLSQQANLRVNRKVKKKDPNNKEISKKKTVSNSKEVYEEVYKKRAISNKKEKFKEKEISKKKVISDNKEVFEEKVIYEKKEIADNKEISSKMSVIAHLEELRKKLFWCICALIICAIPCGIFWQYIFDVIAIWPLHLIDPAPRIIFTAPVEAVMLSFKIAVTGGLILASPIIFQQIWSFISPGLYKKERVVILSAALASTVCFLAGIVFCYMLLPLVFKFLVEFAEGQIEPLFKINEYFSFLVRMCLAFGLAFELPVIAFVLSKMGVIDYRFLIRYFRYAIVAIFILATLLTPPDVLSQILLALPLIALYALSILISFLAGKSTMLFKIDT